MRFVLNTRSDDSATRVCIDELGQRLDAVGIDAVRNDWDHYERYDVAVFMGYDHELEDARMANPNIRVVLADPKLSLPEWILAARAADKLLVSSIEQRDVFMRLNRNVHVFHMFPKIPPADPVPGRGDQLVIGYHGNRVHLEALAGGVRSALEELGRRRPVELRAIYNAEQLGRASIGLPDERFVRTAHVQWRETFYEDLAGVQIGIVPNELPIRDRLDALAQSAWREREFKYEPFDHLLRFKASTNAGRIYPFARRGIPVVADFAPSAVQLIEDGRSGYLASSPSAWLAALEWLADSPERRVDYARRLRARVDELYDRQIGDFLDFVAAPVSPPPPALQGEISVEEQLDRSREYPGPGSGPKARVARAIRKLAPPRP
jgi:hypothetical protein